jgi:uncharacterized protein
MDKGDRTRNIPARIVGTRSGVPRPSPPIGRRAIPTVPLDSRAEIAVGVCNIDANCPGWCLTSEGAAVHHTKKTAVIADVHLGYEWARGNGGDTVPAHSLAEVLAKLEALVERAPISRLIVAGDMVESSKPCPRTASDIDFLTNWLNGRGVELVRLQGNHDPPRFPSNPETLEIDGWIVSHGDRPIRAPRQMIGHHHPAMRVGRFKAPCFLYGPTMIVLPAFSANAAGLDVTLGALPTSLRRAPLRCVASMGGELLDFGLVADLPARLKGA